MNGSSHPRRPARKLVEALGGQAGDDVLALLVADYQQHGGQLSLVLKRPEVGAQFSNWHS